MFDNQSSSDGNGGGKDDTIGNPDLEAILQCRSVRIGSYKYFPSGDISVTSQCLTLNVPMPSDPDNIKKIIIDKKNIVKVLVNFNESLPVIFYSVRPSVGQYLRDRLGMVYGNHTYFNPLSKEECYRWITMVLHIIPEPTKIVIRNIFNKPKNIVGELTSSEANAILIKTCPKEVLREVPNLEHTDIKQLFIYPPGKGGLSVNTEDYMCLAKDQFLNDVVIDFYLKYLILNLPEAVQQKVHLFSTFFFKCLTTKPLKTSRPDELDPDSTPAQKRHTRVQKWTKNVNLFEKDFIIIPINEDSHWFLAIVCFPGMTGCQTWDEYATKPKKNKHKKRFTIFDDSDSSDKSEVERSENELDSTVGSDEQGRPRLTRRPIKQPSILIFDSLAEVSMGPVYAILRDYLTCEYKAKMGKERIFNKDFIKCSCPKVPQQTNLSDCGLYLLQYVEQFFTDPIKDYHVPIKGLNDWFDEFIVTKKRENISNLIKELMVKYNKNPSILPLIAFPSLNNRIRLVDREEDDEDDEEKYYHKTKSSHRPNKDDSSGECKRFKHGDY